MIESIVKDASHWSRWRDKWLYVLLLAICGSPTEGPSMFWNWPGRCKPVSEAPKLWREFRIETSEVLRIVPKKLFTYFRGSCMDMNLFAEGVGRTSYAPRFSWLRGCKGVEGKTSRLDDGL